MDAQDYAIPVSFEAYTLFWNQDIVDEYLDGVIPDTMGGLIEAAQGISEASGGTVAGAGHARHPFAHDHGHGHRHGLQ